MKGTFTINELSESSYYKTYGTPSLELKAEIERAIKDEYIIQKALQTIQFELDEKGGKVKSEAGMLLKATSAMPQDSGFYYSVDDVPVAYQSASIELKQVENNVWEWKADGDNKGKTIKIKDNWYYYEASF